MIALNLFPSDTEEEKKVIYEACEDAGVQVADSDVFAFGGKGALELGRKVLTAVERGSDYKPLYNLDLTLKQKIETIAKEIYGAADVQYDSNVEKELKHIEEWGMGGCRYVSRKTRYLSQMIRLNWERRKGSLFMCVTAVSRQEQDLWSF